MVKVIKTSGLGIRLSDCVEELADGIIYEDKPEPMQRVGRIRLQQQQPTEPVQGERVDFGYPLEEIDWNE